MRRLIDTLVAILKALTRDGRERILSYAALLWILSALGGCSTVEGLCEDETAISHSVRAALSQSP